LEAAGVMDGCGDAGCLVCATNSATVAKPANDVVIPIFISRS